MHALIYKYLRTCIDTQKHRIINAYIHKENTKKDLCLWLQYILQHTVKYCNALQYTASSYNILQHTATHCIRMQHTAAHCNI